MERICPYLALADDGRTVADGFDADHRCHALTPPASLERSRQVQLCLTEAHVRCERFTAARTAWLAASSGLPRVAPDVAFGSTRLILEPEPAWRSRASGSKPINRQTIVIGVLLAAVLALFALGSAFGFFRGTPGPTASPTPSASVAATASPLASQGSSVAEPSISAAPSTLATPNPTATPAPTQRFYTVRQGDTLTTIANQFGTTALAIANANGIGLNDTINVGQRLIIP